MTPSCVNLTHSTQRSHCSCSSKWVLLVIQTHIRMSSAKSQQLLLRTVKQRTNDRRSARANPSANPSHHLENNKFSGSSADGTGKCHGAMRDGPWRRGGQISSVTKLIISQRSNYHISCDSAPHLSPTDRCAHYKGFCLLLSCLRSRRRFFLCGASRSFCDQNEVRLKIVCSGRGNVTR